ncbi:MAG: hypothetical protein U0527_04815 [Candidatus Eisenbacteria bacterium]
MQSSERAGPLPVYREGDCPLDPLLGATCAVVGYGNQGRAHALNLRDSGLEVVVGARPGGAAATRAQADGFSPRSIADAFASAELIALLTPDETHLDLLRTLHAMKLPRLRTLVFAHGFVLRFQSPPLDPSWDVCVVAPAGPGDLLRRRFEEGRGIPAIVAIAQDGSGRASARAKAYGAALGSARAGMSSPRSHKRSRSISSANKPCSAAG